MPDDTKLPRGLSLAECANPNYEPPASRDARQAEKARDLAVQYGSGGPERWQVGTPRPTANGNIMFPILCGSETIGAIFGGADPAKAPEMVRRAKLAAAAPELLAALAFVAETPKHGEPEPADPAYGQNWEEDFGRYAIDRLHEVIDVARAALLGKVPE
jgi:hypothetical protein